ncbi:GlsB/YeaQ/YmgE family stress response membrane protein [Frankia sp. QA3]|uniref:GlsB/YeaQ/YmgE family stress response membrane protein n=1 Tax=Frankia sp. QA3 TaxID=710111 RepID=UPI000269C30B|nr:GlsB/YeaQ/YmgE family stress response membrane protein [Frankia sp. QA3]EIV93134.1 Transglycosylase associated protein [Frankia sp. QA3]
MFQILWIILAGLVIGVLARLILRGRQDIPIWLTVALGIVGALVGNVIASAIGVRHTGGVDWIRHVLQVGVAVALVAVVAPMWAMRHTRSDHHHRHTAGRL